MQGDAKESLTSGTRGWTEPDGEVYLLGGIRIGVLNYEKKEIFR